MKLEWSPSARARAAYIDAYWREERPATEDIFTRELIKAIHQILDYPVTPRVCAHVRGQPVRRVLLKKTHQHVYYIVRRSEGVVRIHAIRGERREPKQMGDD
jgi:plasmid stabilization system protein ParE